MKLTFDKKYTENKYAFPSENIPQEQKRDKQYFLNCANAIIWKMVNNKCALPYESGEDSIATLRAYMKGTNSPDKYKDLVIGKAQGNTGRRKTTMNISWRVPQILAEKMDVVKGYIMKLAYDITVQAIDMQAKMDKDVIVASMKLMIDDKMKLVGEELNEAAGREIVQKEGEQIPFQNEQQVEMFANIGGVLLEQEASIKILLDETVLQSDWEGISEKLAEDVLAAAYIGVRTYNEAGSDVPKFDYIDIDQAGFPYSVYNDYRDIPYAFVVKPTSIADLRTESGLSDREILEVAQKYGRAQGSSQYMPNFYNEANKGYTMDGFGMNLIDSLIVDVAHCVWKGTCTDTVKSYKRKNEGNLVVEKKTDDYQPSESTLKRGVSVDKYSRQCVYKAKLIVGTDFVFDYGEEYNQSYYKDDKGKQCVILPFRFVRTGSTSLTSRAIGFCDDLAIATFRKRNALKKLPPPPNVRIDVSALENVEIGGTKMQPMAIMRLYQDEGYLFTNTQNAFGTQTTNSNVITELPSGVTEQIMLFNQEIEFNIRQIERVTGINEIFSGSTPSAETGLGVSKIAVNATMNAIYPVVRAIETVYEQSLRVAAKKWQIASMGMDEKGRKPMPHDRALRHLKVAKGMSFNDMLIRIKPGATDDEKQMLMADIQNLQNVRRQAGSGGIRPSDYLMLFEMIKAGNITQARLMLAQVEEHIEKLDAEKQSQAVQETAQVQQQSAAQASQGKLQEIQTDAQLQAQREQENIKLKIQGDLMLEEKKADNQRRNMAYENVYGKKTA